MPKGAQVVLGDLDIPETIKAHLTGPEALSTRSMVKQISVVIYKYIDLVEITEEHVTGKPARTFTQWVNENKHYFV